MTTKERKPDLDAVIPHEGYVGLTLDEGIAKFKEKYGIRPEYYWTHNITMCGPLPEEGEK